MKCKECREKIPDNVKYCPECGALINDIKYNVTDFSRYSPELHSEVQRKHNYAPGNDEKTCRPAVFTPEYNRNKKNTKPGIKIPALIIIIVIIVFSGFSVLMNLADEIVFSDTEYGEDFEILPDMSDNSHETVAIEYINNITDSDCMQDTDIFRSHSLIDWDIVFKDLAYKNAKAETEVSDDEFYSFAEEHLSKSFEIINGKFTDDFVPFFFYSEFRTSCLLDEYERQNYIDMISADFKEAGLNINDYFDPSQLTFVCRYEYYVMAENEECTETQDFGMISVVIAEFHGEYYVLYDDVYIQTLLDIIE